MRRHLIQTADFCRWSIYLTVILAAISLVTARLLINQLYLYEENIENWLSATLLTPVQTESARGDWLGVFPVIELEQVSVGAPDAPAATAARVRAEPNYLDSFRHANVVWEDLRVSRLQVELNQQADGNWSLRGMRSDSPEGGAAFSRLMEMFFLSRRILIDGLVANLTFRDGRTLQLDFSELVAENDPDFHRLRLSARIQGSANQLNYLIELEGEAGDPRNMTGSGYLSLSGADVSNLVEILAGDLLDIDDSQAMPAAGALWFDYPGEGRVTAHGQIRLPQFRLRDAEPMALEAGLVLDSPNPGEWGIWLDSPELSYSDQRLELQQIGLQRQGNRMQVTAAGFELADLLDLFRQLDLIPVNRESDIDALNPAGTVEALLVDIPLNNRANWAVRANLNPISLGAWRKAPAVSNLTAYLEMTANAGKVLIDSRDTEVAFPLFRQPLLHESLKGQVGWRINRRDASLLIFSSLLESEGAYGQASGQFRLLTPLDDSFPSDFTLAAGIRNARASDWDRFVPLSAPQSLWQWLDQADVQGRLGQVGFIYRGALREQMSDYRRIQMRASLEGGGLRFAPDWPELESIGGQLLISDGRAAVAAEQAFIAGLDISSIALNVVSGEMQFELDSSGDLSNYQKLLLNSPVGAGLGDDFDQLVFAGRATSHLAVMMDLDAPDQAVVDMRMMLQNNQLLVPALDFSVEQITGELRYDQVGLHSEQLVGELWGKELVGSLSSTGAGTELNVQTDIAMEDLRNWPMLPLPHGLEGQISVQGSLSFQPAPGLSRYLFRSDTLGLNSDIPGLLSKRSDESRELEVILVDAPAGPALELNWGEMMNASFDLNPQGGVRQGAFSLNAERPDKLPGILRGHLITDELNLSEWQAYLASADSTEQWEGLSLSPDIAIRAQRTLFAGLDLGPMQGSLVEGAGRQNLRFQSSFGGGTLGLWDAGEGYPLEFEWLDLKSLPRLQTADQEPDAQEVDLFNPSRLLPMDLTVHSMHYGDRELGNWNFQIEPLDGGARVAGLDAQYPGGEISSQSGSELLWLLDDAGQYQSKLMLDTEIENVADLFASFGQPRALTSEDGSLALDLEWAGAPWQIALEKMQGSASLELNQGNFSASVQGVGNAMMKLVGLVNIQNWGRRLQFDFSDLTGDGTAYDSLTARVELDQGRVSTTEPVNINLATGRLRLNGNFDLIQNQVEGELIANLPVRDNLTWITGVVAGLPAAAGVWLFGELFKDELDSFARVTYDISGSLEAPKVEPRAAEDI